MYSWRGKREVDSGGRFMERGGGRGHSNEWHRANRGAFRGGNGSSEGGGSEQNDWAQGSYGNFDGGMPRGRQGRGRGRLGNWRGNSRGGGGRHRYEDGVGEAGWEDGTWAEDRGSHEVWRDSGGEKKTLLNDEDNDIVEENVAGFKINEAYAKRFQHNKEREDMHRLKELEKNGMAGHDDEDDESSDEEEDEDGLLPLKTEQKIYETLSKIKRKDPTIYQPDVKFFDEEDDEEEELEEEGDQEKAQAKEKKKKPMYLKDVVARQLLEDGAEAEDEEEEEAHGQKGRGEEADREGNAGRLVYDEEQQKLKKEFLSGIDDVAGDDEDDEEAVGGLLKVRKKARAREGDEEGGGGGEEGEDAIASRLKEAFGGEEEMDETSRFLHDYLLNKGWLDRDAGRVPSYREVVGGREGGVDEEGAPLDVSEDEEELERQEHYESKYNMRHEEDEHADRVVGHSRFVEGSVRKKSEARKQERLRKEQRSLEMIRQRKEELKRLKNVKRREILERLAKIRQVAGLEQAEDADEAGEGGDVAALGVGLTEEDLEEDFNPEEYDRRMKEAFGEQYYDARDPDLSVLKEHEKEWAGEKPDFDAEDELLGLPKGWDGRDDGVGHGGFTAIREKLKGREGGEEDEEGEEEGGGDEGGGSEEGKTGGEGEGEEEEDEEVQRRSRKKKGRVSLKEKMAFDKRLEEYYKLDYEDMIGDLPTRFHYKQVLPNAYGLSVEDVLVLDDQDLNQHVSLKKLAPYRMEEYVPDKTSRRQLQLKKAEKMAAYEYHGESHVRGGVDSQKEKRKEKKWKEGGMGGKKHRGAKEEGEERGSVEAEQEMEKGGKRRRKHKEADSSGNGKNVDDVVVGIGGSEEGGEREKKLKKKHVVSEEGDKNGDGENVKVMKEKKDKTRKRGKEGMSEGDGASKVELVKEGKEDGEMKAVGEDGDGDGVKHKSRKRKKSKGGLGLTLSRLKSYGQEALPEQNRKKKEEGKGYFKRLREEAAK